MPYQGLNSNSYGKRSVENFRWCDPNDGYASVQTSDAGKEQLSEFTHKIAASIPSWVGAPFGGLPKVDANMVALDLIQFFKIPGDSDHPAVAVIADNPSEIVFWHSAKLAHPSEVKVAAVAFCQRTKKTSVYQGSANVCPPVAVGYQGMAVLHTYSIAAFSCQ